MNYFKYTNGEAFVLDGFDYIGYFNIIDQIAYTGRIFDKDSQILTPKDTFISEVYIGKYETNTTYKNIQPIEEKYSNAFDIFNNTGLVNVTDNIKSNNIICYKNLILSNPTVYNFQENNGVYYALSSIDDTNALNIPSKKNYIGNCELFADITNLKFMDNIISGVLLVNSSEKFTYLLTDGEKTYTYNGKFEENTPLEYVKSVDNISFGVDDYAYKNPDYVYSIHQDEPNNKIIYVKSSNIEIHDALNYNDCPDTILEDRISLKPSEIKFMKWNSSDEKFSNPTIKFKWNEKFIIYNENNPSSIKFGYNYRTQIDNATNTLIISNKYSSDIIYNISLNALNIFNIISIDIRSIDDHILILHKNSDKINISHFSVANTSDIKQWDIESVLLSANNYNVKFTEYDSDVFTLSNDLEYQTRFLSNPTYPSGRLELAELNYPIPTVWNNTLQLWNNNNYTWNSNRKPSNFYKNIISSTCIKNNKMYMLLHNVGRIYAISQPINERFLDIIPLDLVRKFGNSSCGDTSLGLKLNIIFKSLIDDTLSILRNSSNGVSIEERKIIYKQLEDFTLISENLYMNTNETFNVLMIRRILFEIYKIQSKIIPS